MLSAGVYSSLNRCPGHGSIHYAGIKEANAQSARNLSSDNALAGRSRTVNGNCKSTTDVWFQLAPIAFLSKFAFQTVAPNDYKVDLNIGQGTMMERYSLLGTGRPVSHQLLSQEIR